MTIAKQVLQTLVDGLGGGLVLTLSLLDHGGVGVFAGAEWGVLDVS